MCVYVCVCVCVCVYASSSVQSFFLFPVKKIANGTTSMEQLTSSFGFWYFNRFDER
jgi:hypothetical protein